MIQFRMHVGERKQQKGESAYSHLHGDNYIAGN